jgi:hypothetical protein
VLQTGTKGPGPVCALRRPRGHPPVPAGNRAGTKGLAFSPAAGTKGPYGPGLKALSPLVIYTFNNVDLLPRWLPMHILLDVGYGEQDTILPSILSSGPLVLVTASNGSLHAKKQLMTR